MKRVQSRRSNVQVLHVAPSLLAEHEHLEQRERVVRSTDRHILRPIRLHHHEDRCAVGRLTRMNVPHPVNAVLGDFGEMRLAPLVNANGRRGAQFVRDAVADQGVDGVALRKQDAALVLADLGDLLDRAEWSVGHVVFEDVDLVASVQSDQQQRELVLGNKLKKNVFKFSKILKHPG